MRKTCVLKRRVLECVDWFGNATSRGIALRLTGVSQENASMTLLKCKRQGLVGRRELRRGRVRSYVYWLSERGAKRLRYYRSREARPSTAVFVDVESFVKDARDDADIFHFFASNAWDAKGTQCTGSLEKHRRAILHVRKPELVEAFAAKKVLRVLAPNVSDAVEENSKESTPQDLAELFMLAEMPEATHEPDSSSDLDRLRNLAIMKKFDDLNVGQFYLYCQYLNEKKRANTAEDELKELKTEYTKLLARVLAHVIPKRTHAPTPLTRRSQLQTALATPLQ